MTLLTLTRWRTALAISRHLATGRVRHFSKSQKEVTVEVPGGQPIRISTGKLARFADGSAVANIGQTSVLATVVCKSPTVTPGTTLAPSATPSFVPLTVDYRQKAAAAGRIPTNHLRRELGGPTDAEVLTGRVIDRSVRPLFPKAFGLETQIVCNMLCVDGQGCRPDVAALNAASAALAASDVPWRGPVGAVRVGRDRQSRELLLNPSRRQRASSDLDVIVAGDRRGRVVMLEAEADNVHRDDFLLAVQHGLDACRVIAATIQDELATEHKRELPPTSTATDELRQSIDLMCRQRVMAIYCHDQHDKISRDRAVFAVRDEVLASLRQSQANVDSGHFFECFNQMCRSLVASLVLDNGRRVDGRAVDQMRELSCEADLHQPLHGSALFQRGQTQVMCTVALDSKMAALKADPVSELTGAVKEKGFFLHYEFPPYATNDIGRTGIGRRELGHGALAERALRPLVPADHPFTIRLTSEVLESNGSSSMATVCGGTLALLDAGVPLTAPAAGVAVGLVAETNDEGDIRRHQVLLDILGLEDYLGDMDFKMAGTEDGVTALQADIKLPGIPFEVVRDATFMAGCGIGQLLGVMRRCRPRAREDKTNLPVAVEMELPPHKRAKLVGPGGINLRNITSETGARLSQSEEEDFK